MATLSLALNTYVIQPYSVVPIPSFTVANHKFCCLSYFREVINVTKVLARVALHGSALSVSCLICANVLVFHGEGLLASRSKFRWEDHPSSPVCDPLFNTLTATFLLHPRPKNPLNLLLVHVHVW